MNALSAELFEQSEYDLGTADILIREDRFPYAVFFCHLAIEKALKAVYFSSLNKKPPKTHNLIYLIEEIDLDIPGHLLRSIMRINRVQIESRYPDDLKKLLMNYDRNIIDEIFNTSKEIIQWLKDS
jgi:HEPN domain-containing protein